jgi:hypothetical protein
MPTPGDVVELISGSRRAGKQGFVTAQRVLDAGPGVIQATPLTTHPPRDRI